MLDLSQFIEIQLDPLQQLQSEILMRHLAPAKPHRDLGLVTVAEEPLQISQFGLVITLSRTGSKFYFLELDLLLLFTCRLALFALLKNKLPVVHQPADRGVRSGRDLYQVKLRRFRQGQGFLSRDDPHLFSIRADKANLSRSNLFIEPALFLRDDIYFSF